MPFPRHRHRDQKSAEQHTRHWALTHRLLDEKQGAVDFDYLHYTDLIGGYYVGAPLPTLISINNFSLWFFVWDDVHDRCIVHRRQDTWLRLRDRLHMALDKPQAYMHDPDPLVSSFGDCLFHLFELLSTRWNARFITHFHATINAYDQEYRNRTTGSIPTVEDYVALRQHTFGMWIWIDCLELAAEYELPAEIYFGAPYRGAALASQEFSAWYNDLQSMPKELAMGDFHNLGIILAHQEGQTALEAAGEVARRIEGRIASYREHEADVRHLLDALDASVDLRAGVERCLFNMRNWLSSVYEFHDRSGRYQSHLWKSPAKPPYVHDPDDPWS